MFSITSPYAVLLKVKLFSSDFSINFSGAVIGIFRVKTVSRLFRAWDLYPLQKRRVQSHFALVLYTGCPENLALCLNGWGTETWAVSSQQLLCRKTYLTVWDLARLDQTSNCCFCVQESQASRSFSNQRPLTSTLHTIMGVSNQCKKDSG